jgi:hypothetical protein
MSIAKQIDDGIGAFKLLITKGIKSSSDNHHFSNRKSFWTGGEHTPNSIMTGVWSLLDFGIALTKERILRTRCLVFLWSLEENSLLVCVVLFLT